ncbi:trihelix transcription factor GT-2-like [Dorcoceras hygrometricum]|uniref:Trihelix transcription factor GT-2-like n=1 Tax=Dorcoceras hygrometricum TaxID=472368 RepID=A0A2Z7AJ19_9LAMI|nr:trihelix transcription factor GT-2-like [Dorcoceras hygrometricum]
MATRPNSTQENEITSGGQSSLERSDDRSKTQRHPRWTRQETMVLAQGKKIAEQRGRKGRRLGPEQAEPKWDFVSAYCIQHGVKRGAVQCRKRWSNLASDYKKIKTWESQVQNGGESYWIMPSDLRRERKLPGYFDQEIYHVLDGQEFTNAAYQLALVTTSAGEIYGAEGEEESQETETEVSDGTPAAADNGSLQDIEIGSTEKENIPEDGKADTIPSPVPISEMRYQPYHQAYINPGTENKRHSGPQFWQRSTYHEGAKRRRHTSSSCQNFNVETQLIKALEKNISLLNSQLQEQKIISQMDREQQKDCHNVLVTALAKLTDALEKIGDKLQHQETKDA